MKSGSQRHLPAAAGFTLVEVMISIALVVIIILGVNQVFSLTNKTIGAGQALGEAQRSGRVFHSTLTTDLAAVDIERAPFFIIANSNSLGFRNPTDMAGDADFEPNAVTPTPLQYRTQVRTWDQNGNGIETDDTVLSVAVPTSRVHRTDQLTFFTRSRNKQQAGSGSSFYVNRPSGEAYVSYSHLRQPNAADLADTTAPIPAWLKGGRDPGVIHMGAAQRPNQNDFNFFASDWIVGRNALLLVEPDSSGRINDVETGNNLYYYRHAGGSNLTPFTSGTTPKSVATNGTVVTTDEVQWARFDLAGTSIDAFRKITADHASAAASTWFDDLVFGFNGFPLPNKPLTTAGVSRTVPCLLPHCTQFIVEYAGDFLDQTTNPLGANGSDGLIDYNLGAGDVRSVRWYGFPRNTHAPDNEIVRGQDVVPLRDYLGSAATFERRVPATPASIGYINPNGSDATPLGPTSEYRCIWGPDTAELPRPKMLRIVIAIDDPNGRLTNEQYFEYVFELP